MIGNRQGVTEGPGFNTCSQEKKSNIYSTLPPPAQSASSHYFATQKTEEDLLTRSPFYLLLCSLYVLLPYNRQKNKVVTLATTLSS